MSTYMRSTITTPLAPPLVHTNPEEGIGMRYHGPGCGGRYMTSSIGISPGPAAYGLAINKHPDLVAFVNAVLEQLRMDGQWSASYAHWIGTPAPAAEYRS